MSSKQSTVDFILEQISGAGEISAKKMFGEYALYSRSSRFSAANLEIWNQQAA